MAPVTHGASISLVAIRFKEKAFNHTHEGIQVTELALGMRPYQWVDCVQSQISKQMSGI